MKKKENIKIVFDTDLDFFYFSLQELTHKIKIKLLDLKGKKEDTLVWDIAYKEAQEIENYFSTRKTSLDIENYKPLKEEEKKEIEAKLKAYFLSVLNNKELASLDPSITNLLQKRFELEKKEEDLKKREEELEKKETLARLNRQPRNYLKTTAKYVGKSTGGEPSLFSIPDIDKPSGGLVRDVISKNTAILGNYLLQLWQQKGEAELTIKNLAPLSEMMGNTNYEIKIYLLYLGGYTYPIIDSDKDGLTLTTEQLFKIKFKYSPQVREKYKSTDFNFIGTDLTKFIKDEPIESITVTPSLLFIKAMEGRGLGNVLVVNDKFIKLALSITDIAYKILTFTASNRPSQTIAEDNLVKHLGIDKQIKTQGRPRVRGTILKGLQELKDKGHIKNYSFDEGKKLYQFTYSDKFVKHSEKKKD